eukprot:798976-Amphidinium_carterae.2
MASAESSDPYALVACVQASFTNGDEIVRRGAEADMFSGGGVVASLLRESAEAQLLIVVHGTVSVQGGALNVVQIVSSVRHTPGLRNESLHKCKRHCSARTSEWHGTSL